MIHMKKVRITAIRKTCYPELTEKYDNPIQHACDVQEGQVWIANGRAKPEDFCDGWMKNPKSAMISCNDGFWPVSFYPEALDEDAE